jgi:diacylglycerol kinase (ATP)
MQVVMVFNPRSGRGNAPIVANLLRDRLLGAGHDVHMVSVGGEAPIDLRRILLDSGGSASGLVVVGGDGTVLSAADAAIETGASIYHVPMGTENLFARSFAMTCDAGRLIDALAAHAARLARSEPAVDAGDCNGKRFLIMASVGFDANVVHRLAEARRGRITHLTYVRHIVGESLRPTTMPLTIRVDGREVVSASPGLAIVANSRHYAMRADPARHADMRDGLLDLCFMPTRHPVTALLWLTRAKLGRHLHARGVVHVRGATIEIEAVGGPMPVQLDGEAAKALLGESDFPAPMRTPVTLTVRPGALRVMLPA